MILIKTFGDISKIDTEIAGGKGASLGEMTRAGISVPQGFVILSTAFEKFLEETDLNVEIDSILSAVDYQKMHTVENASEKIQSLILNAELSKELKDEIQKFFKQLGADYVAVRSSATAEDSESAAWAGQLDSFLNTTKKDLIENVQKCWASLFTPRAVFYRFEKNLQKQKISVAVVIQEMIESEKSGIAFSVHPVTQDKNQMIIEAGFGLGEAIVSGSITPDSYVVSKSDNNIIDINVHEQVKMLSRKSGGGNSWLDLGAKGLKQVLNEKEILELADVIKKIEKHYKKPQDIEWAYAEGKFFITQSRPITTLDTITPTKIQKNLDEYEIHTSVSGFSILLLDMIINNNETYGAVDYVLLYENDITRFYLSSQGMKECYDLSTQLLDDDFFKNLLIESEKLHDELKKYRPTLLNSQNIQEEWGKSLKLNDEFCKLYRFYEQPFQQAIETSILSTISKEELVEILSKHAVDTIQDSHAKKYVKRLIQMGEMKLRLHEDSETYFTDNSFAEYIAKKNDLSVNLVNAMRKNEIKSALNGNTTVTVDELSQRLKGCVYIKEKDEWNLYTGDKFTYWKNKLQGTHDGEVSGDVAFPGIVAGKVVIHLSWTDITEVQEGDVLVTGMTNPQMIPMLKKAAAIITDEGGITCHAAIISRELKKPCIVGTKNATQILKNGDYVEVDANNGVVHLIEKV
ncbi:MAG: PEP/pyruvate-binding domain-containing protein [Candidatus Peregrinibacteria bacterium]|nr:PEP/pyruvate-binding domain-containing protein [Candidatus Peregrinibacteria bacterium]